MEENIWIVNSLICSAITFNFHSIVADSNPLIRWLLFFYDLEIHTPVDNLMMEIG